MGSKLSIIVPCFNCEKTLAEAVNSAYQQELTLPFELILVNDASTDNSQKIIEGLAQKYPNLRYYRHEKNLGGGATRNTAIEKTQGNIIFCLDSDDILPPAMLPKMLGLMKEKMCDGVVFEETRFFEKNKDQTENIKNTVEPNIPFKIENLFEAKGFLTMHNFMYTKGAFYQAGGYPIHHGFDTQSFGFKFLAKNLVVYVCPKTYYLQRRNTKGKTYFERVYESGDYSKNFYFVMEEIFSLFSDRIKSAIINYDIFKKTKLGEDNLSKKLGNLYLENPEGFFLKDGREDTKTGRLVEDLFTSAINFYKQKQYSEAIRCYEEIVGQGVVSPIIYFNILRNFAGLSGKYNDDRREKEVQILISSMIPVKQRKFTRHPLFVKIIRHLGLKDLALKILTILGF